MRILFFYWSCIRKHFKMCHLEQNLVVPLRFNGVICPTYIWWRYSLQIHENETLPSISDLIFWNVSIYIILFKGNAILIHSELYSCIIVITSYMKNDRLRNLINIQVFIELNNYNHMTRKVFDLVQCKLWFHNRWQKIWCLTRNHFHGPYTPGKLICMGPP